MEVANTQNLSTPCMCDLVTQLHLSMCKSLAIRCSLPCRVASANVSCLESLLRHLPTHTIEVLEMKGDFISGAKGLEGGTRLNVRLVFKRRARGETTVVGSQSKADAAAARMCVLPVPKAPITRNGTLGSEDIICFRGYSLSSVNSFITLFSEALKADLTATALFKWFVSGKSLLTAIGLR